MERPPELQPDAGPVSRALGLGLAAALLVAIAWLHSLTGAELELFPFYFVPISLAAWRAGRSWGVAFGIGAAICWYLSDRLTGHQHPRAWIASWETLARLVAFLTTALTLSAIRAALSRERRLVLELSDSLARVRQLEGLVPVCAHCRRIRDDEGYRERFEAYLSARPGATFTHGICPSCYDRLHGGDVPRSRAGRARGR